MGYPNQEIFGKKVVPTESEYPQYFAARRRLENVNKIANPDITPSYSAKELWDYYASGNDTLKEWARVIVMPRPQVS